MSYVLVTYPKFKAFTDAGLPAAKYKVYAYTASTSTPADTYSNRLLTTANTWPIVLNSVGEATIYVGAATKLILTTPTGSIDSPVWTVDYLGEQTDTYLVGTTTAGTTNNNYVVTVTPSPSSLTDGMLLVWTPDKDNTDSMGSTTFTGTGANDCVYSGPYIGTTSGSTFQVQIDGTTPDTFQWRKDAESWVTGVAITGDDQTLKEGISVNFAILSGHVEDDLWVLEVNSPTRLNLNSLGNDLIYKNFGGALQTLNGGDLKDGIPALTVRSSDQSAWILINTADPVLEEEQRKLIRVQSDDDYSLTAADHGVELNFTNTSAKSLALPDAASFVDMFVDVRAGGSADVTIDADGTELIYGRRSPGGAGTYTLKHTMGDAVRITTNGVDWHILNESPIPISRQKITATGDYTKPSGCHTILVQVCGASGGGASDTGYGGGGGGYGEKLIDARAITTVSCTIGAKGVGGLASAGPHDGTAGGTTSFGTHITITGGAAGTAATPGAGGVSSDGDINLVGQIGSDSFGGAGAGPFGGHAQTVLASDGILYGGGGPPGGAGVDGGDGVAGIILITEHY